jgi:YHS domain-containing protein
MRNKLFGLGLDVLVGVIALSLSANAAEKGLALDGNSPVALIDSSKTVKGDAAINSSLGNYEYHFASAEEKKTFDDRPNAYAIQNNGIDPVSKGRGDPKIFSVFKKKIYIFADEKSKESFEKDPSSYLEQPKPRHEGS